MEVPCAPVGPVGPTSPAPRTRTHEANVLPFPLTLSTRIVTESPTIIVITPSIKLLGAEVLAKRALVPTVKASTLFTAKFLVTEFSIVKLLEEVTPK
jgi:hypothetical protein